MIPERVNGATKAELWVAATVVVVGAVLRFWGAASFGIDHYDEGVYVISAMGVGDPSVPQRMFPDQIFFAPPLYFGLVALGHATSGVALDVVAVLVSALFGTLPIPLVWRVGRRWFGAGAGVCAAALLALSDFHIALSRSALTDATFVFFFLLAAWLIVRALDSGGVLAALLAGVATGLAWNTKYHGWMALAAAAAAHPLLVVRRGMPERWRRDLWVWLTMAGTAVALYLPWAAYVESLPGGYERLTMHQRLFVESDWLANLWLQVQRQAYLDGWLTDISVLVAAAAALFVTAARTGLASWSIAALGIAAAGGWMFGGWAVILILAVAGLLWAHRLVRLGPATGAMWFALFAALTPFYRPYARLFLPLTLAACMLGGYAVARLVAARRPDGHTIFDAMVLLTVAMLFTSIPVWGRAADPWRPSRGAAEAAASMASTIPAGSRVKVIEEPPLTYYLYRLGFDTLRDAASVEVPADEAEPIYVVTGPYGQDAQLRSLGERVKQLGSYRMRVKDLRMVDDINPPYDDAQPERELELKLYVVAPRGGGCPGCAGLWPACLVCGPEVRVPRTGGPRTQAPVSGDRSAPE